MSPETVIVGIDCATVSQKVGLAIGRLSSQGLEITNICSGSKGQSVGSAVSQWIQGENRVLLAIDAPLGWPADLGKNLSTHIAGGKLSVEPNLLFRRETDRFIKRTIGKQSLDVGADRIARTALAALEILETVRRETSSPVPLAWESTYPDKIAAIEVYPAALLAALRLPSSGYKKPTDREKRQEIIAGLSARWAMSSDPQSMIDSDDVLDATICVLAGHEFLSNRVMQPEDLALAKKEGWIWTSPLKVGEQRVEGSSV